MMKLAVCLLPLFPLLGFLLNGLAGRKFSKNIAALTGCLPVLASFVISLCLFIQLLKGEITVITVDCFDWLQAGGLSVPFSFLIDPLSSVMLLVVTGVGFLIHVYSAGYMHDDEAFARFFAYMNLFIMFMLLLVLGNNYAVMFCGWEGVGLCSYLLIGFWFKNTAYNNAAKKAFIMNRIGDLGFLLGMFLIYNTFGSLSYKEVFEGAGRFTSGTPEITAIALLLFVGAIGKSAQIPLYTWLPDAMAGPTPVSALIHAATMVTAGVYMIARSNILYALSPAAMGVVAAVGAATAVFAATIGLVQNDIKKVLAYSTVSQLGYMFVAMGVGAFTGGIFHLVTHAFFKALLFLGAGSVIHAMGGEQDIRKMGGLRKHLPVTFYTFLIAAIAISGIPPFAGFFSKDEILGYAFAGNRLVWLLGILGSVLTAFYMFRLFYLTFSGKFRGTETQLSHLHESPKIMTVPLVILALLSAAGGFIGMPAVFGGTHFLANFLSPVFAEGAQRLSLPELSHGMELVLMAVAVFIAAAAILYARNVYVLKQGVPAGEQDELPVLHRLVYRKYYVDELYDKIIVKPLMALSGVFYSFLDIRVIDGLVNFSGSLVLKTSSVLRKTQAGTIGFYVFAMVIGVILVLLYNIMM